MLQTLRKQLSFRNAMLKILKAWKISSTRTWRVTGKA